MRLYRIFEDKKCTKLSNTTSRVCNFQNIFWNSITTNKADMNEKINKPMTVTEIADFIRNPTDIGHEMWLEKLNARESRKTEMASNLLFRQILEMGDAIQELIKVGCVNASKPLLRTLLECYFQFRYQIIDNEERKALLFFYHYEMRLKEYYRKLAFPKEGGSFFEKMKNDNLLKGSKFNKQRQNYIDNIKKIEQTLSSDDYKKLR